jgi:hypothetical protein
VKQQNAMAPSAAGYSETPLLKKLGIRQGMRVGLVAAPRAVDDMLDPLPDGVELRRPLRRNEHVDLAIAFATRAGRLARDIHWLVATVPVDGALWVAWPKRASGVGTDITENVVREIALPLGWVDTKVCAIDATWSGLKLVLRRELRGKGASRDPE